MKFVHKKKHSVHTENVELLRLTFSRQLWKTLFFALASVSVLALASIAWFVSNTQVHSDSASVSAEFKPIKLATSGKRQQVEQDILNLNEGEELTDSNGETQKDSEGNPYYCTNGDTIALRLSDTNQEVSPGSKGKVEFYVITGGGISSVTLQIGLGGYGEDENDNNAVKPIQNSALNSLMSGHILLFDDYEDGAYSNWLFEESGSNSSIFNNTITVDLSGKPAGVPVPVDFYWIWPLRYENMENDFTNLEDVKNFVNTQAGNEAMKDLDNGKSYYYSRIFLTDQNDLSQSAERSKAYDLADEYIGSNAQYLYLTIQTIGYDNMEGEQQQ